MNEIQQLIDSLVEDRNSLEIELVPLAASLDRVLAEDLVSRLNLPLYNESQRDGFALHKRYEVNSNGTGSFAIKGEVAAGDQGEGRLLRQQVFKVMTGAEVPDYCERVVPKELGDVSAETVRFSAEVLGGRRKFIKRKGSEVERGELIVPCGNVLLPGHLARIAEVGIEKVQVFKRPQICFFCTGKELVNSIEDLQPGQKISSNRYLLSALIQKFGADWHDFGIVEDDFLSLKKMLGAIDLSAYDMVISTGGTGPGKYDLVERALREVGGHVFTTSLNMRPGKSVVMGTLQDVAFCGLPGPPNAAEALFYEIVGPAILKMQGFSGVWPEVMQAYLEHDISLKSWDVVHLKGGIFHMRDGKCWVSRANSEEFSTCNIVLQPNNDVKKAGELVEIHLKSSPFGK